jgi:FKBP12-rapamycin complex-associated protein
MWARGRKQESFDFLRDFCVNLARDVGVQETAKAPQVEEIRHLLARSYLKQGEWQQELTPWTPDTIEEIINCYQMATEFDPNWSKAWHSWALCNFEAVNHLDSLEDEAEDRENETLLQYILSAIKGLHLFQVFYPDLTSR